MVHKVHKVPQATMVPKEPKVLKVPKEPQVITELTGHRVHKAQQVT